MTNLDTLVVYKLSNMIIEDKRKSFKAFYHKFQMFPVSEQTLIELYEIIKVLRIHPFRYKLAHPMKVLFSMMITIPVSTITWNFMIPGPIPKDTETHVVKWDDKSTQEFTPWKMVPIRRSFTY